ncbi:MAG: hypothetical protein QNI88_12725 [Desulfobacterales bacterium]|nr:hypothetical protein [Desulfobacterales bacterium]
MGKDSLLESTSKKKPKAKKAKGKAAKKAAAPKGKARKAPAKAKAKPKGAPAKKIAAKAAKAPAKVKKGAAHKKAPTKPKPTKKPTRKELLFKKFATPPAKTLYTPPTAAGDADDTSPSYFAGMSDATVATAKEALKRKFDWDAIKAAGQKYAAELVAKAEEEAKRKAEEEARRKAEEEAKRKAEEEAQRKAEEEAQRKAEEEAQRKAEEEAQRKAEEDAKRRAEEDAKRRAEEEARLKAEIAAAAPPPGDITAESGGNKPLKFGLVAFGAILLLLIMSSYTNTKKYYITEKDGTVTIQRGTFTPMGTTVLISMTDVPMPEPAQDVYGWQDAYRLMYQHYINAADKLLEAPGIPDAAALATQLGMAVKYAPDRELRDDARSRLVGMRVQVLVHKAQAAMQRRTIEGVQVALAFLEEAADLDLSEGEAALVDQRTAEAEKLMADLEAAQAEAERQAAEEAALAAEAQKLKATAASSQAAVTDDTH